MPDATNLSQPLLGCVRHIAHRFAEQQRATAAVRAALDGLLRDGTDAPPVTNESVAVG